MSKEKQYRCRCSKNLVVYEKAEQKSESERDGKWNTKWGM